MSEENARPRVAYFKVEFLPPTAGLTAEHLRSLQRYDPVVLAVTAPDLMGVPETVVRSLDRINPVSRAFNRLSLRLGTGCPYFEGQARREDCRLIHALSGVDALDALPLRRRTRRPLVTTFLGGEASRVLRRQPRVYRRLFAEGELFLATSEATRKQLLALGCPEERLRVQHVGVDTEQIPFSERHLDDGGAVNILLAGSLVERKGFSYALHAFSTVHRYQRRISLTVIGDGPDRPAIEALLRELNLNDVRLLGAQPREVVLAEMQRAHIYLQPSITANDGDGESIPVSLIEARASGLPVVATWHGGIPEIVADGQSGFLVSERNAHALAERLRHLIEHPELWAPFGRAGRAAVEERFNLRRQVAALEDHYDELLAAT